MELGLLSLYRSYYFADSASHAVISTFQAKLGGGRDAAKKMYTQLCLKGQYVKKESSTKKKMTF